MKEKSKTPFLERIKIVLIIFVAIICLVSLATKAAHKDAINAKGTALTDRRDWSEVYSGLDGCIAIDSIIIILLMVGMVFAFVASCKKYIKFPVILITICFIIRIILAVQFLAGNQEAVRKAVEYCAENNSEYCHDQYTSGERILPYCPDDPWCNAYFFNTLKDAWVFEIVAFTIINTCGWIDLYFLFHKRN